MSMEKAFDFGKVPKADEYVPVELKIIGGKEVVRKKDGKSYQVLVCEDDQGREVSLFDWGICEREGKPFVLRKHLRQALDTAQNRK